MLAKPYRRRLLTIVFLFQSISPTTKKSFVWFFNEQIEICVYYILHGLQHQRPLCGFLYSKNEWFLTQNPKPRFLPKNWISKIWKMFEPKNQVFEIVKFLRSWRKMHVKINFRIKFCSRCPYPEVGATKNHEKDFLYGCQEGWRRSNYWWI